MIVTFLIRLIDFIVFDKFSIPKDLQRSLVSYLSRLMLRTSIISLLTWLNEFKSLSREYC